MRTRPTSDEGHKGKTEEGAVRGRVAMARGGRRREITGEGAWDADETTGRAGRKARRGDMHGQGADIVDRDVGEEWVGQVLCTENGLGKNSGPWVG